MLIQNPPSTIGARRRGITEQETSRNPYEQTQNMSNDSGKDKNSSSDQVLEAAVTAGDGALATGEQSAAILETRVVDPRTLQHFQTALMNLVSEANKIGLSLPIGMGVSSPYKLTTSTPGNHPLGRLRSEIHITTPDAQTKPFMGDTPQV